MAVDQPDVDAVGLAPLHELAEGRQLLLRVHIQEAAVRAQAEVGIELLRKPVQFAPEVHDELELRARSAGVHPDVSEVPARGAIGQLVGLEQRHRRTSTREVVCGRAADDAAADDEDVRGTGHLTSGPRQADRTWSAGSRRYQHARRRRM